jgi:uncharacterized protein with HEPN domain
MTFTREITYLQDLLAYVAKIRKFTAMGYDEFLANEMAQEAVIRCFEVVGEIIKRLPESLKERHPHIPWRRFAGFRDILIHRYAEVELSVVWEAIQTQLDPLQLAAESLIVELEEAGPRGPSDAGGL